MKLLNYFLISAGVIGLSLQAQAATIASWDFETSPPADLLNSATYSGISSNAGAGMASGVHAGAGTDWSTPSGAASVNAFGVNTWAIGDYFQFQVATVGFSSLNLSWNQMGSNTGPKDFELAYSTDGTLFTSIYSYVQINDGWNGALGATAGATFSYDFSAVTALDNAPTVYFRLVATSISPVDSGSAFSLNGTSRVDNFVVSGVAAIPEPGTAVMWLGGIGSVLFFRRRRSS